jgi:hypothetical protein
MMRFIVLALIAALLPVAALAQAPSRAALHIVLVVDGLRPDSINERDTPNLHRLKTEGVWFTNSHAVFPTVTRVNSTAIATGTYPARNGIMGNSIYVPAVDAKRAFTNDDAQKLLVLKDRIVTAPGLADALKAMNERYVAVSSGSTGSALLLAPNAPGGIGTVINGYFGDGIVAYPKEAGAEILKRFGPPPKKGGAKDDYNESVTWAANVVEGYVLPELKPKVLVHWMTEPDHIQHGLGAGSPQAIASIRHDDDRIGTMLKKLESLGLRDRVNIMVVSDHGFGHTVHNVNVNEELRTAGLLPAEENGEVIVASSGQAIALHVKDRDRKRIAAIAEFLQKQPWCAVIFTARGKGAAHEGMAAGTFALEYAHLGGHERSPDLVFTFPWSSARNKHGVPGTDYNFVTTGSTGPASVDTANHGGIGPWTVANTMLAWGPDFKRGAVVRMPSSNVDVAPTLLHLLGRSGVLATLDGRPLLEAMAGGPDEEQVALEVRTVRVSNGAYSAVLQASDVAGKRYIDKGWRER